MCIGGFVLAGGLSRRMGGVDKALLLHPSGETMLNRTARIVCEAAGNVTILGPASRYGGMGFPTLPDAVAESGPLAGIYTALRESGCERVLVAPVDLPHLTVDFLQRLLGVAGRCVIAQGQPLCGVYRRDCLEVFEAALREGRLRVIAAAQELGAQEIVPDDPQMLQNRNTPEDWQTA
jgi:molybdopterin-guanine dinucleotide biosynthesis protein A